MMDCDVKTGIVYETLGCDFSVLEELYLSEQNEYAPILKKMNASDRCLLILYAELNSVRKVAKIYGMGSTTIYNKLKKIREQWPVLTY